MQMVDFALPRRDSEWIRSGRRSQGSWKWTMTKGPWPPNWMQPEQPCQSTIATMTATFKERLVSHSLWPS